jgi:hypothetical protein
MLKAVDMLGPQAASQVQLLGIDVNPAKTQAADLSAYTRAHGLEGRWRFLTGSREQLEKVWRDYGVYVAATNDDIEHNAEVILIDPKGNESSFDSTLMSYQAVSEEAHDLAKEISELLPAHPDVPDEATEAQAGAQRTGTQEDASTPNPSFTLTSFGPQKQPVVFEGAHPHLMVFFAGWLSESSDLAKNLSALDSYAELARRRGWPSPVAVDELITEPSPEKAQSLLSPVAAELHTPIVQDASGELADGYEVNDLPWFVLKSPSGKVLWNHDGWLSAAELNRQLGTVLGAK